MGAIRGQFCSVRFPESVMAFIFSVSVSKYSALCLLLFDVVHTTDKEEYQTAKMATNKL